MPNRGQRQSSCQGTLKSGSKNKVGEASTAMCVVLAGRLVKVVVVMFRVRGRRRFRYRVDEDGAHKEAESYPVVQIRKTKQLSRPAERPMQLSRFGAGAGVDGMAKRTC